MTKGEDELLKLPEKPQAVIDFEAMKPKDKQAVRDSSEWPEIARYYDQYQDVIQHNVSFHAHKMRMGEELIGLVQYVGNTFIFPVHKPVPKDQQWERGPDKIWHKPDCEHRISGYRKAEGCYCAGKRKRVFSDLPKEPERKERLPYKDDVEEVPF